MCYDRMVVALQAMPTLYEHRLLVASTPTRGKCHLEMVTSRQGVCEGSLCFSKSRTKSAVIVVVAYRVNGDMLIIAAWRETIRGVVSFGYIPFLLLDRKLVAR